MSSPFDAEDNKPWLREHISYDDRIVNALDLIIRYGQTDEINHSHWVIDQVVRELCASDDRYKKLVDAYIGGDPDNWHWEKGIAP